MFIESVKCDTRNGRESTGATDPLYRRVMAEKAKKDGAGSAFGQEQPPLYVYIKRILERYPGGQIFKVFVLSWGQLAIQCV